MENKDTRQPQSQKVVAPATDIYNEENLLTGESEVEVKKEFEEWFKVKIQGLVNSFRLHEDGSLQLKFQHQIKKNIAGTEFIDYEDKSIRIRKEKGSYSEREAQNFQYKSVEVISVKEMPVFVKKINGDYDFNRVERYLYSANNVKIIEKNIENGFELFKVIEFKVKEAIPAISYDQRKRTQIIDKDKSVLLYEVSNGTLITLHKITVQGMPLNKAKDLKDKDVIVLDLTQIGKNYYCSKIKLKG